MPLHKYLRSPSRQAISAPVFFAISTAAVSNIDGRMHKYAVIRLLSSPALSFRCDARGPHVYLQILMGFVMLFAVVAVVVVINSGGSLDARRRLALLPNRTLDSGAAAWGAEAALKHSKRVLRHVDNADDMTGGVSEGGRQPSRSPEGGNTSRRRRGLRVRSSDVDKSRQLV